MATSQQLRPDEAPARRSPGWSRVLAGVVLGRRRRRPWWVPLAVVVGVLVLLLGARSCVQVSLDNPFRERTTDRSQPALLRSIQDLSRYEAATANLQVVIDLQRDADFIPAAIFGERTLFVAAGTVDAYVDFGRLSGDGLEVSGDRRTVRLQLPPPALEDANLDQDRSYVFAQQRGLVNRFQSLIGADDPNRLQRLYQLAEDRLEAAAGSSDLVATAERNTRAMLEGLLRALGFTTVEVRFDRP